MLQLSFGALQNDAEMSTRPFVPSPAGLCTAHFGFKPVSCVELDSYNDRNYQVRHPRGPHYVLKVHNHIESADRDAVQVLPPRPQPLPPPPRHTHIVLLGLDIVFVSSDDRFVI